MLDLAYEKDQFVTGSSVLDISMYENQLWTFYLTYIQRSKIDRLETTTLNTAYYSGCDKVKGKIKAKELLAKPLEMKKSSSDMFNMHKFFKPKKDKK